MSNDAATLLVGASTDFLRNFSPFNRMEAEALAFVAERAVLAFHARGSEILTPESGVPTHFYIVQRGKVLEEIRVQALECRAVHRLVRRAPPDVVLGQNVADDELVLG